MAPPPPPPAVPVQIESPWLVQNILEIKLNSEGNKHSIDALTALVSQLIIQMNTAAAITGRRPRNPNRESHSGDK